MPIRFQVDADFYDHPKALGMSDAATALWVRAGSYSAAKLTDGFIADAALALFSQTPLEAARELVRRGLWSRVRGGYVFHQWGDRNLLRARVEAERASDRQRKRRERQHPPALAKPQANGHVVRSDSGADSAVTPTGIRGLSVSVSESVSGSGRAADAEPPPRCVQHLNEDRPPPCGDCADARRANGRWHADRRKRVDDAPKCRQHRGQPADNCAPCRSERLSVA